MPMTLRAESCGWTQRRSRQRRCSGDWTLRRTTGRMASSRPSGGRPSRPRKVGGTALRSRMSCVRVWLMWRTRSASGNNAALINCEFRHIKRDKYYRFKLRNPPNGNWHKYPFISITPTRPSKSFKRKQILHFRTNNPPIYQNFKKIPNTKHNRVKK